MKPSLGSGFSSSRTTIDPTDERILALLVRNARRSASDIGREVGLSPAATKRRIDRLESSGVITGYRATIAHDKLGGQIEAFTELRFAGQTEVDQIAGTYESLPELVEGFTIAGDTDALVHLRVRDLDHLKHVIDSMRRNARVTGTKTLIVLGTTRGEG